MPEKLRKNGRRPFTIRMTQELIDQVKFDADRHGLQLADYVEMVLRQRGLINMDYFAQQAAFQSFVSAAMVIHLSRKVMSKDELAAAQKFVYSAAATLFGQPSRRPSEIGEDPDDLDPRVTALFEAYDGW